MIIYQKFIRRKDLRDNPDICYVFGDNDMRSGFGGQAKEMRGEPNAIGIRTKKSPENIESAYYTDEEYSENVRKISEDIGKIEQMLFLRKTVVIPASGIGTGLTRLQEFAPRTLKFICEKLDNLAKRYGKILA